MQIEKNRDLVSIIIPAYNSEKYIEECIGNILNQSYKKIEVIVIDDGSTDATASIVNGICLYDTRVKLYSQNNAGVSAARNLGLNKSSGGFITFIDSDDLVSEKYIEILYRESVTYNLDISCTRCRRVYRRTMNRGSDKKNSVVYETNEAIEKLLYQQDIGNTCWGKLFKEKIIKNIRFDSGLKYAEDLKFVLNVILNSKRIGVNASITYFYFQNPYSAMHEPFNSRILEKISVVNHIQSILYGYPKGIQNALVSRKFVSYLQVYRDLPLDDNNYMDIRADIRRFINDNRNYLISDGKALAKNRLAALSTYLPESVMLTLGKITKNK